MTNTSHGVAGVLFGTHVTTKQKAETLLRDGFKSGGGTVFGSGVYISVDDFFDAIPFYIRLATDHAVVGSDCVVLICKATVTNPLTIELPSYEIDEFEHELLGGHLARILDPAATDDDCVGDIAFRRHYDAVCLIDSGTFVPELGGDQVLVANPSAIEVIAVIDTADFPADNPEDLYDAWYDLCSHASETIAGLTVRS